MVKGVSKQVVEILHTENEYFEKVILFVNPEKAGTERKELKKQADYFVHAYLRGKRGFGRRPAGKIWKSVCLTVLGMLAGALLSALVLVL